jgi:biopolymer transport protein ExbD
VRMRRPASRSGVEEINVTPLIDVVMCLIIFFLIVGKLAQDGQVGVRLPESGVGRPSEPAEGEFVTVAVRPLSAGGAGGAGADAARWRVTVDGQAPADGGEAALAALLGERVDALARRLGLSERAAATVVVRADRDLPFAAVEPVLRAAATAGLTGVRLAAERVPDGAGGAGGSGAGGGGAGGGGGGGSGAGGGR